MRAGSKPMSESSSSTRARTRAAGQPRSSGTVATFWPIVRCGKRPTCWMTYPILRRSCVGSSLSTFCPSIRISPEVGSISLFTMRSDVVLPHPDGPMSTQMRPAGAVRLRWSTATVSP